MRSEFKKAYEPNPHKSPFTEVRFNEEKQIYEPLNTTLDRVARSLNAAWYGYRIRQTKVDDAMAKAQMCRDEKTHAINRWSAVCKERDELQRRNKALIDSIKEQGQKLVYQNEVIETQSEKLLGLRDEKAELQKRVDAVQALAERWKAYKGLDIKQIGLQNCANELEQALKCSEESKPSDKNKPA